MKNKKIIAGIIAAAVVCVGIFAVVMTTLAFYSTSYVHLNSLNKVANTRNVDEIVSANDRFSKDALLKISKDALLKLKITTDNIAENEYVQFKTKHRLPKVSFGKIEYSYDITAQVLDWDSWQVLREYSGHKTVAFAFDFGAFRWNVESVE